MNQLPQMLKNLKLAGKLIRVSVYIKQRSWSLNITQENITQIYKIEYFLNFDSLEFIQFFITNFQCQLNNVNYW